MAPMDVQVADDAAEQFGVDTTLLGGSRVAPPQDEEQEGQEGPTQPKEGKEGSKPIGGDVSPVSSGSTDSIQARLDDLTKPGSLYWKTLGLTEQEHHPRQALLQEVQRLHQALAGEQSQAQQPEQPAEQPEMLASPPQGWVREDEVAARSLGVELGVPAPMVNDALSAMAKGGQAQQYDSPEALEAAARSKWGTEYDNKLYYARLAVSTVGPEFADLLDQTGAGNHLGLMEYLAGVGETLETTQQEINRVLKSPAYLDAGHLDHKAALQTMKTLQETRHFLKRDLR